MFNLYDDFYSNPRQRLYMQPTSDDSSHDEALSSRVAALNMLDLGLEHLDIHAESTGPELDAVVKACGESGFFAFITDGTVTHETTFHFHSAITIGYMP